MVIIRQDASRWELPGKQGEGARAEIYNYVGYSSISDKVVFSVALKIISTY